MSEQIDWYAVIPDHYRDPEWLDENADPIHETLSRGIKNRDEAVTAINRLLMIFPHLLEREDLKRWGRILKEAYKVANNIKPDEDDRSTFTLIYRLERRPKNIRPTKRRRRERIDSREILEIYITLLASQVFQPVNELTAERIGDALDFARKINDPPMYNKLYQTLALVYNSRLEYKTALDYGQMSYEYWLQQDPADPLVKLEKAITAYAIATSYYGLKELDNSVIWLETASEHFAQTDNAVQHGVISGQTACIYISKKEFTTAIQWAQLAVEELSRENLDFHLATAYHFLGMAQSRNGNYQEALNSLQDSITIWKEIDNFQLQLYTEHTLAYTLAKMGNLEEANQQIESNLQGIASLPDSNWKNRLTEDTNKLVEAIEQDRLNEI